MSTLVGRLVRFTAAFADPDVNGRVVEVAYSQTNCDWVVLILYAIGNEIDRRIPVPR